ncbi:MAG: hypothetical protein ACREAK_04265 [Nitrosarchaeum sp.]
MTLKQYTYCTSMKDINTVFTERLDDISSNLKESNYRVCDKIAHDLVNLAWNLELKDEVFISEILESIFMNLSVTIDGYEVPEDKAKELKDQMIKLMQPLRDAYKNKNSTSLYNTLKELRYCATFHQLTAWQKYRPTSRRKFLMERE